MRRRKHKRIRHARAHLTTTTWSLITISLFTLMWTYYYCTYKIIRICGQPNTHPSLSLSLSLLIEDTRRRRTMRTKIMSNAHWICRQMLNVYMMTAVILHIWTNGQWAARRSLTGHVNLNMHECSKSSFLLLWQSIRA